MFAKNFNLSFYADKFHTITLTFGGCFNKFNIIFGLFVFIFGLFIFILYLLYYQFDCLYTVIVSSDYHFQFNLISIFVWSNHMHNSSRQFFTSSILNKSSDFTDDKDKLLDQFETPQLTSNSSPLFKPVHTYENAQIQKFDILQENSNKSGIYRWVNQVNGRSYIGSAIDLGKRLNEHYSGNRSNTLLQQAIKKYSLASFSIEILEFCDKTVLIEREQFFFSLFDKKYNLSPTAGSPLGIIRSAETRQKLSEAFSGERNPFFGKFHTLETRQKMSDAQGGVNNPMFGSSHSEETRQKISIAHSGKVLSSVTKNKIGEAQKGKMLSDVTKSKISSAMMGDKHPFFGKSHTLESREKIRASKGITIYLYSLEHQLLLTFSSSRAAAEHFKCGKNTIMKFARSGKIFKNQFILSLEEFPLTNLPSSK